jgi:hypothetical protein
VLEGRENFAQPGIDKTNKQQAHNTENGEKRGDPVSSNHFTAQKRMTSELRRSE